MKIFRSSANSRGDQQRATHMPLFLKCIAICQKSFTMPVPKKPIFVLLVSFAIPCYSQGTTPSHSLIETLIHQCIDDKKGDFENKEIRNGSISRNTKRENEENNTTDPFHRAYSKLEEVDKLNGITYRRLFSINYIYRKINDDGYNGQTYGKWEEGRSDFFVLVENNILTFTNHGYHSCFYTKDMKKVKPKNIDIN